MHRKLWMLLLCSGLLVGGCHANRADEQTKTRLKVAVFNGAYDDSYWETCIERFEKQYPNVDVDLHVSANIGNLLLPRVDVKDLPDVVYLGSSNASGFTQKLVEEQLLEPLDDVFTPELQNRFLDNVLQSTQLRPYDDQKLYLAPLYYNVTGLWYNQALFDEKGYQVPRTWDDFFALGDQAKQDGIDLFTYQGLSPTYLEAMLWPMLAQQIGMDGLDALYHYEADAWSMPGVSEVLDVFERIANGGYMSEDTILLSYTDAQTRFIDSKALFIPCGNWLPQEMMDDIQAQDDFMFTQVPSFHLEDDAYATVMLEQIYVPSYAKEKELAKAFVAFQFEDENVKTNETLGGGYVPIKQTVNRDETPQPYRVFDEGVTPLTVNFQLRSGYDMERVIFDQLAMILSKQQTADEMIAYMNNLYANIK